MKRGWIGLTLLLVLLVSGAVSAWRVESWQSPLADAVVLPSVLSAQSLPGSWMPSGKPRYPIGGIFCEKAQTGFFAHPICGGRLLFLIPSGETTTLL